MRTDPRYTRVVGMLTAPEVPRHANGGIALCHLCQRQVYFDGGFMQHLIKKVRRASSARAADKARASFEARAMAALANAERPA